VIRIHDPALSNTDDRQGYKYVVQRFLTQDNIHCNIAITPQPRKPNQTIITDTINAASKQIASFRPVCRDDNPELVERFCIFSIAGDCYRIDKQ
jgi:hypothetical protein